MLSYTNLALVEAENKANVGLTNPASAEVIAGQQFTLAAMPWVTKQIDQIKHMEFAPRRQVRYFDAPPSIPLDPNSNCILLDKPLAVPITVQVADTVLTQWTPGQSFASRQATDYYLYPVGRTPAIQVFFNTQWQTNSLPLSSYGQPVAQVVSMDALWGYRQFYSTDAWYLSAATVTDNPLSSTALTVNVSSTTPFSPGMWIRFNDQSNPALDEISEIVAVGTNQITLASRGGDAGRGTTPTSHVQNTPIDIWQTEPVVERAATKWAAYLLARRGVYESLKVTMGASGSVSQFFPLGIPQEVSDILSEIIDWNFLKSPTWG